MYKVFVNDLRLILTEDIEIELSKKTLEYEGPETLKKAIELLENKYMKELYVFCPNVRLAWAQFLDFFEYIEAAGGVVKNKKGQLLFIFRRGKWDLPKGKLDEGELPKIAAIREIHEECGITGLEIKKELPSTYHTYKQDGKRVLKRTHWFLMNYNGNEKLTPQTEEDITGISWLDEIKLLKAFSNTYRSVKEVIKSTKMKEVGKS